MPNDETISEEEFHEEITLADLEMLERNGRKECIKKEQVARTELSILIATAYHQLYRNGITLEALPSSPTEMIWVQSKVGEPKQYITTTIGSSKSSLKGKGTATESKAKDRKVTISKEIEYQDFTEGAEKLRKLSHWIRIQNESQAACLQVMMLRSEYGRDSTFEESWCQAQERLEEQLCVSNQDQGILGCQTEDISSSIAASILATTDDDPIPTSIVDEPNGFYVGSSDDSFSDTSPSSDDYMTDEEWYSCVY